MSAPVNLGCVTIPYTLAAEAFANCLVDVVFLTNIDYIISLSYYTPPKKKRVRDDNEDLSVPACKRQAVNLTRPYERLSYSTKTATNVLSKFPPDPLSADQCDDIIRRFVTATSPNKFEEVGCAVCAQLMKRIDCVPLDINSDSIQFLSEFAIVTRSEHCDQTAPVSTIPGPVLDHSCHVVCKECMTDLNDRKLQRSRLLMVFGPVKFLMSYKG